jgi:tRNA threonylcarbamoyladenosine modification (KEOPS) complex  Pcc1 subunit
MFSAKVRIDCEQPKLVAEALKPDITNDETSSTRLSAGKNFVEIEVRSEKLNRLKGILNSYISVVQMLLKVGGDGE